MSGIDQSTVDIAALERRVRVTARALARHGLVQAWGHCSARIDRQRFLVCAARPMGRIGVGEPGTIVHVDQPLPAGVLGEVRIHQQVYRQRPDIGGVCRMMPPVTTALSTLRIVPRPRHGVGAFNAGCRFWDDPRLLRDDKLAAELVAHMGRAPSLVMRANGAVTVGGSIEIAACLAWCLEDAARVEERVRAVATVSEAAATQLTLEEISVRQVSTGHVFERLWDYLVGDDPEALGGEGEFPAPAWGEP